MFSSSINPSSFLPKFDFQSSGRTNQPRNLDEPLQEAPDNSKISPQQLVDLHVIDTLEKALNADKLSLKGLEAIDFSPQAVSERILSSVRQAFGTFQQSHPESEQSEFFSLVNEGLEKGFAEAKDMLDKLGVLQGQIAANVDETYDLTLQGLHGMQSGLNKPGAVSDMAFESVAMQTSHSGQIQIETREGDVISIDFSQSSTVSQSTLAMSQSVASLNAFQKSASYSSELNISIEGNLNADEQKALKHLMQDMHKISNAFFHGNDKTALHHAMKLGLDGEQIAGFSMGFSSRQSVQAMTAYQQSSQSEQTVDGGLLSQAGDFLAQAKTLLADVQNSLQTMADSRQAFNDLFVGIGMLTSENSGQVVDDADLQGFGALIDMLGRNLLSDEIISQAA